MTMGPTTTASTTKDSSLFLGDLNIVAVPPSSTTPGGNSGIAGNKRRKNNKYERRRQKAKKAREQKKKSPHQQKEVENGQRNEESTPSIPFQHDQPVTVAPVTDSDTASATVPVAVASTNRSTNEQSMAAGNDHVIDHRQHEISNNSSRQNYQQSNSSSIEHAEYLAEFHARPMELDRRSGARATTSTVVSKASSHLFEDDDDDGDKSDVDDKNNNDGGTSKNNLSMKEQRRSTYNAWESLGLHPRLVQTVRGKSDDVVKSTTNSFNLERPTMIQSKAIRAIMSPSSSASNIGIQSETGSGKTLAFLLPILQMIAYGNSRGGGENGIDAFSSPSKRPTRSELGCRCIILCPTRELASQTLDVVEKICRANFAGWIVPGGLLGGDSRNSEKSRLRKGLGVIVATPGRLLDHLGKTQSLAMSLKGGKLQWLVLDECDRLLDMGLGDQIRQVVQLIRSNDGGISTTPSWRSVMVSATVTPSVKALAKERMLCGEQDWSWIKGASDKKGKIEKPDDRQDGTGTDATNDESTNGTYAESTPRQLTQFHLTVTAKLRLSTLVAFLVQRINKGERTVVFMGTCASVDYHYALFQAVEQTLWNSDNNEDIRDGTNDAKTGLFGSKAQLFKLHGNVPHAKRHQTMKQFNVATEIASNKKSKGSPAVLLTTDVAARGLNLEDIDWTVQYDPPCEINDYVHRAGRTARAGKAGHSLLFLLPSEQNYLEVLKAKGVTSLTPLSLSSLLNHAASICTDITEEGMYQQGNGDAKAQKRGDDKASKSSISLKSARRGEYFSAEVQRRLEECVVQDDAESRKQWKEAMKEQKKRKKNGDSGGLVRKKEGELLELARDAFLSFLRAYPTKREQAVRSIFSSRSLHLGHVAKSFALKDPPKSLAAKGKSKRQQQEEETRDEQLNLPKALAFSQQVQQEHNDDDFDMQSRILNDIPIISDGGFDDHDFSRAVNIGKKRRKTDRDGRSAKQLLLENATKMQKNLMDAM